MSTRLQVVLEDKELRDLRRLAKQEGMTVSEWVRRALREARRRGPAQDQARKLAAVRDAARHEFPAPDIDAMLDEIEDGYKAGMPAWSSWTRTYPCISSERYPHKRDAERLLQIAITDGRRLVTDAEVFQEILHRYSAIRRLDAVSPAFEALLKVVDEVFAVTLEDAQRAREILLAGATRVSARDALHIAIMEREARNRDYDIRHGLRRRRADPARSVVVQLEQSQAYSSAAESAECPDPRLAFSPTISNFEVRSLIRGPACCSRCDRWHRPDDRELRRQICWYVVLRRSRYDRTRYSESSPSIAAGLGD
jgi:predicted nucleic acid-binding protein